ncbi:peptidase inhibitor family I36 protein [Streptomyces antimycoticus]|uniref:peptidase inhibitor family I36 protein n=1 Tax=Streptomyces antimycoticus TaxID=68175 RepID=UPI0036EDAB2C
MWFRPPAPAREERWSFNVGVNHLSRGLAAAALTVPLLTAAAPAAAPAAPRPAGIDCPDGSVCIYPETNLGGQPWVKRAVDGSVKDLPAAGAISLPPTQSDGGVCRSEFSPGPGSISGQPSHAR